MNGELVGTVANCKMTGHMGYVIAYVEKPCYVIQSADGERYTVKHDQLHAVPSYDEIEYWKDRTRIAEEKLRSAKP